MMHSHIDKDKFKFDQKFVLILVVMDDALAHNMETPFVSICHVLILVVMDDALARMTFIPLSNDSSLVLILVVMDDALALFKHV